MTVEPLTLAAALAAGLAGSAHCVAMCGGIATAAGGSFRAAAGAGLPWREAAVFNVARIAGYALVGALLAVSFGALADALPIPQVAWAGRVFAVVVMAALAVRLLTGRDVLGIERLGAAAWTWLKPLFRHAVALPAGARPAAMGLLWGFLPCGLVYSVLLVAAAGGEPAGAAAAMAAFGLGTLPPLLGLTLGAASLGEVLRRPGVRRLAGVAVLACAAWTLGAALGWGDPAHLHLGGPAPADCHH